jgi:A/G-specific adenine glycosylase
MEKQSKIRLFRRRLLKWFRVVGRDLPWRRTNDPYRIVVSEIMLQQTQVDRVIPKYEAFLKKFPSFKVLAKAAQSEVVKMWHGLGYNRRALGLRKLAITLRTTNYELPTASDELIKLPGIGPYTAEAVRAFAFRKKGAAPVDTNIERVLKRIFGAHKKDRAGIQELAREVVADDSWSYNHAVMDFGASICTARAPKCEICPMRDFCASYPCEGNDIKKARQPTFEDSDRFYRGKIISLLRERSVLRHNSLALEIGLPRDGVRLDKILQSLVKDGFVSIKRGKIVLE